MGTPETYTNRARVGQRQRFAIEIKYGADAKRALAKGVLEDLAAEFRVKPQSVRKWEAAYNIKARRRCRECRHIFRYEEMKPNGMCPDCSRQSMKSMAAKQRPADPQYLLIQDIPKGMLCSPGQLKCRFVQGANCE